MNEWRVIAKNVFEKFHFLWTKKLIGPKYQIKLKRNEFSSNSVGSAWNQVLLKQPWGGHVTQTGLNLYWRPGHRPYLFSGLATVCSLSSVKTELRARCNLWRKKKKASLTSLFLRLWVCVSAWRYRTWLVCSQYLKRGSFTLGITSLYTMCSATVVSSDKATPTHSITNRPEKCLMPICSVWRQGRRIYQGCIYNQVSLTSDLHVLSTGSSIGCFLEIQRGLWNNSSCEAGLLESRIKIRDLKMGRGWAL